MQDRQDIFVVFVAFQMKEMKNNLPKAENNPANHVNPIKLQNVSQYVDKTVDRTISVMAMAVFEKKYGRI